MSLAGFFVSGFILGAAGIVLGLIQAWPREENEAWAWPGLLIAGAALLFVILWAFLLGSVELND
jgi:hypothetical protein